MFSPTAQVTPEQPSDFREQGSTMILTPNTNLRAGSLTTEARPHELPWQARIPVFTRNQSAPVRGLQPQPTVLPAVDEGASAPRKKAKHHLQAAEAARRRRQAAHGPRRGQRQVLNRMSLGAGVSKAVVGERPPAGTPTKVSKVRQKCNEKLIRMIAGRSTRRQVGQMGSGSLNAGQRNG